MTVRELIDELEKKDMHSRVGVCVVRGRGDTEMEAELEEIYEDHSGSKLEILLRGYE